jgi:NDP-sugar pyrophosphorylase family protein
MHAMKAMIFAAGLGTRLKPFTNEHPKALAPVNKRTLLEWAIRYLQQYDIHEVIVNVHHFADQIIDTLRENDGFGSRYYISDERAMVLETGGGLKFANSFFKDEKALLVMNVDILTNLNLHRLIAFHEQNQAAATLAITKRSSSRHLLFNEAMQLCAWENTQTKEQKIARKESNLHPYAFSGIQIIGNELLNHMHHEGKFSIIDEYLFQAQHHSILGFDHSGDILLDVGKPESLEKAAQLFPLG